MSVVIDTSRSPHARLRSLPLSAVRLTDRFWQPRREVNQRVTLPSQYQKCEETGRIDNFRRAAGKIGGPFRGRYYNDSDVYKWVEACAFALAEGPDPELERLLELVIPEIADAQGPDGYLNTYFTHERAGERWTDLRVLHELYCAGHLIQAAVAHQRCTGREDLLRVARRYADYILDVFGPGKRAGTCGHQEIEMAMVELYRLAGDERYLTQARLFIERRGMQPPVLGGGNYLQDHAPFLTLDDVTGHAVRMVYYCAGAADLYAETGDEAYLDTLERLWDSMVHRRSYVTGGIGSRWEGEAFGEDYELPNDRAYAESCAAIGSVLWNWRMLQLRGEARFAERIENTLYNAMLPSLSLDGEQYFYQNPLADTGKHRRQPWFECACCPPNIARMLASLPGYFYGTSEDEDGFAIWAHLYAAGEATVELPDGGTVRLIQETDYPWDGEICLRVESTSSHPFGLRLRIPSWTSRPSLRVDHEPELFNLPLGAYHVIEARDWSDGGSIRLSLPMVPAVIESHPYVANNRGCVALCRGPLIYCVEQVDVGVDPRDLIVPVGIDLKTERRDDLLGGVVILRGSAAVRDTAGAWNSALYTEGGQTPQPDEQGVELLAVPYYAWGNREPGGMAVWLRQDGR